MVIWANNNNEKFHTFFCYGVGQVTLVQIDEGIVVLYCNQMDQLCNALPEYLKLSNSTPVY